MNGYRGIKVHKDIDLYNSNGTINGTIKNALDSLADILNEKEHILLSEYMNAKTKVLIDFRCGHKPHWILPKNYRGGQGCPKCMIEKRMRKSEKELIDLINKNGHELLSKYDGSHEKVLINFKCGHKPHKITPNAYKRGNRCPKCGSVITEDTKRKISEAIKNLTPEKKERIVEGMRNNRYTENYAKKLSDTKLGELNPQSILNEDKVREIKRLWKTKRYSAQALGDMFNVSRQCASDIVHGRTWKSVQIDEE